jgi:flavin reductase
MKTLQELWAGSAANGGPAAAGGPAASAFRQAMGSFPTGVTVVTVATGDGSMYGVTVNSFSSVSLDPMLVLVCLNENSRGIGPIERAGAFAVNVLSAAQRDVARWFADRHRPGGSLMFDGMPFEPGVTGCPVLFGATASFECRLRQSHPAGDHLIVLGEVVALVHRPELEPLIFHQGAYKAHGHWPGADPRPPGRSTRLPAPR